MLLYVRLSFHSHTLNSSITAGATHVPSSFPHSISDSAVSAQGGRNRFTTLQGHKSDSFPRTFTTTLGHVHKLDS